MSDDEVPLLKEWIYTLIVLVFMSILFLIPIVVIAIHKFNL